METPQQAIHAGEIAYKKAAKALEAWDLAYRAWVDAKGRYTRAYTEAFDSLRAKGEAVKSCELHAQEQCSDLETVMLLAEGDYRIQKAAHELYKQAMLFSQSTMRTMSAEMEMSR